MLRGLMTYGALCTKSKALFGKRLRVSDFQHMAGLHSEQEVLDYLRQQPGWKVAAGVLTTGNEGYVGRVELEAALWEQIRWDYESLLHFAPRQDKALLNFPVLLAENRAILASLRRLKAGHAREVTAANKLLIHSTLDAGALADSADYDGVCQAARRTIYAPALERLRPRQGGLPDYAAAEMLLRSTYFSHMLQVVHKSYAGDTQRVLLRFYGEQIDLLNIIHILRLKTYFPETQTYLTALFPFNYRLRPELIRALCQAPGPEGVFELLRTSPYAGSFDQIQVTEVEDYYRRAFCRFARQVLTGGAPSIYAPVAYLNLKEMELRALVTVIESVKYGVPYDDAFAQLIGA